MRPALLAFVLLALLGCSKPMDPASPSPGAVNTKPIAAPASSPVGETEQAVIVHIDLDGTTPAPTDPVWVAESKVSDAIKAAQVGDYDGNEVGGGEFVMYAYGPDAAKLGDVVAKALREAKLPYKAVLTKRFGSPGAKESKEDLAASASGQTK